MSIRGLWSGEVNTLCEKVSFEVEGQFGRKRLEHVIAVSSLSLPSQSLSKELAESAEAQVNTTITAYQNARPLILIGQDNWSLIMPIEFRRIDGRGLVISRSALGWSVHGYTEEDKQRVSASQFQTSCSKIADKTLSNERESLASLDCLIRQYFDVENLGVSDTGARKRENERALRILHETTRKVGKQWETGLLWKSESMPNVDSKATAMKRLRSLERKLDQKPAFAARYYREMKRLIQSGYAKKVTKELDRPRVWYVPHFGVENVNKPDKVRLVFDAAAKSGGVALNDLLETGPDLLESLLGVLLRFRQYPVAVKADIKDMYLRVSVIEQDRGAQRFLWRGTDRKREPDVYENTSLIFGSKSSPCSAIYVKNKNADRFAKTKPEAAKSIVKSSYMDDYLASGKSASEMRQRVQDVTQINGEANFFMHGWASNDARVVMDVREENRLDKTVKASLCNEEERVLGLYWDRLDDTLSFNVGLNKIRAELMQGLVKPTKREFFSVAMSVYDPLGILSPFTLQAKLIMQDIWRSGVNWDEPIRDEEFTNWRTWIQNLSEIKSCKIPRCYLAAGTNETTAQLHVFCDASLQAYAAAAYLRTEAREGDVHVSLIMSKSRVAPVKPTTVPRLELQAALLGARMAETIAKEIDFDVRERIFWSDSTTVLHWIRANPREKQMFVANRLGEIGAITKVAEWRWVPTDKNPADDATRSSSEPMRSADRWLVGPDFLRDQPDSWPKAKALTEATLRQMNDLEARKEFIGTTFVSEPPKPAVPVDIRILGWNRMRHTAMLVRKYFYVWHSGACSRKKRTSSSQQALTVGNESLNEKEVEGDNFWYRAIQLAYFSSERELLTNGKELPKGSKLIALSPFIDDEGLLRAQGRVSKLVGAQFQNQPIILDASHYATKILIREYHVLYKHANNETIVNELRQRFYIIGLRTRLRWLSKHCPTCLKRRAKPFNPPMADLPRPRLAYGERPFTHCGIDYFGPMFVKIGRRREKRWGVLFTCMSVRAIHLELAHTLSASSAIMAIQRLAGRRGFPRDMYSDNGTNFTKASKELRDAISSIDTAKQQQFAKSKRFRWHFNPPDAAHMGGAWERLIRSVKIALDHALNDQAPSEEVLATLMVEIEHMVNSRPLTHVSVDPRDEEALTPNHFLIGCSSGHVQLDKYNVEVSHPRKTFEVAQNFANGFWRRWLREYLPTLLPRKKWHASSPPLQLGDIVLITDYQAPRNSWRKGKVVEVYPNKTDNVIRVVKVRSGSKDLVRPVNKLVKIFESKIE